MTATEALGSAPPVVPGNELRHDRLVVVPLVAADPVLKQVVLETVTANGRSLPQSRKPVEQR